MSKQVPFFKERYVYSILLKSGANLAAKHCQPDMMKYLYGCHHNRLFFDLAKSLYLFKVALNFLVIIYQQKGSIFFYVDNPSYAKIIKPFFKNSGSVKLLSNNWVGGSITNWEKLFNKYKKEEAPHILLVYQTSKNITPIKEAFKKGIPIIAFINADVSSRMVTYPIPCNTKSIKTFYIFMFTLFRALKLNLKNISHASFDRYSF